MQPDPKSAGKTTEGVRAFAQPVALPLTRAAIFLVVTLKPGSEVRSTVRSFCADLSGIFRAVEMRDLEAALSCIMGFGSADATQFPHPAICSFTFARSAWIFASRWPRKSWRASEMR